MERTCRRLGGPSARPAGLCTVASTENCPDRTTSALTCTCRRPSGGIRCGGIGATRRPVVLEMLRRTSIVTGSPFAIASSSGASLVPSE